MKIENSKVNKTVNIFPLKNLVLCENFTRHKKSKWFKFAQTILIVIYKSN